MASDTRYDRFREVLRQDFTDSRTYTPALASGERAVILNIADPEFVGNDSFLEKGPFNSIYVRNLSVEDITLQFDRDRDTTFTIPGEKDQVDAVDTLPRRYIGFLTVTNEGANPIAEGDLEIHIGNEVDSLELELLKMSGLLDVSDPGCQ